MSTDISTDILTDLLRSAWLVHAARARVYEIWRPHDERFAASILRARRQAEIIEETLVHGGRGPDVELMEPHASWIVSLIGERPDEMPLSDIFLTRLGDWVEGHAKPFLAGDSDEFTRLADEEKAATILPDELPVAAPFERLPIPEVEPPGEVRFRFGILADTHIGSPRGEPLVRAAIADLNASGAELVIQLGDVTDHGNEREFELAATVFADLQVPCATMMGNHDVWSYEEQELKGREYFERHLGRPADGTLIEHKGVRFAVLDSAEHSASPFGPFNLVTGAFMDGQGGAIVRGALSTPQHDILAEIAAPGSGPAFIFMHHPLQPFTSFPPVLFGLRDGDTGRIHAVADSGNVWGVFAGHTHRNALEHPFGDVPCLEVAIPRDYPFGYALVDVTDTGYAYRFLQISDDDLVRDAAKNVGDIQRRYGTGSESSRGFSWTAPT